MFKKGERVKVWDGSFNKVLENGVLRHSNGLARQGHEYTVLEVNGNVLIDEKGRRLDIMLVSDDKSRIVFTQIDMVKRVRRYCTCYCCCRNCC